MDMTNSMFVWQGGVVGIVRAELEIAKNMKKANPDVRFFGFDGSKFVPIADEALTWLWESDSVGDAYLQVMNRVPQNKNDSAPATEELATDGVMALRRQYPGLENAYCYSSSRLHRCVWGLLLYANTLPKGLQWLVKNFIYVTTDPLKKLSLKRAQRKERLVAENSAPVLPVKTEAANMPMHPFSDGDLAFSCGWMLSGKEAAFEKVKEELANFRITYLVYDLIILKESTRQFYDYFLTSNFKSYIDWISMHCDEILYGGVTAMKDTQAYQKEHSLPVPPGHPVYFGSNIAKKGLLSEEAGKKFAEKIGIDGDFILAVGSLDERKNYSTLYRAINILMEKTPEQCPQLVIVGRGEASKELVETMATDPLVCNKIIITSPSDEELDWLYRKSKFVVLASAWEGWSLTLPEALQYQKMTIVSDVAPLKEIGNSLVVYADTFDPFDWAEKIAYYNTHPNEIKKYEQNLKCLYVPITWEDCGKQISKTLENISKCTAVEKSQNIYMDISLAWNVANWGGNITGILRAELMLAKHLYAINPQMKFFALFDSWGYFPIDVSALAEVLTGDNLDADFNVCRPKLQRIPEKRPEIAVVSSEPEETENKEDNIYACKRDAFWFLLSVLPLKYQQKLIPYGKKKKEQLLKKVYQAPEEKHEKKHKKKHEKKEPEVYQVPFKAGDIVFTAGTSSGKETYEKLLNTKAKIGYKYCPIVYDYTPILLPQVHRQETIDHYIPFLKFTSEMADFILYGGETAQHDGIAYQEKHKLPQPKSCAIKFGSDISKEKGVRDAKKEAEILERLGITGPFVMMVGTMEVRKNHETIYRAYLRMLEEYEDVPQLVFAGHPGWKSGDFLATLSRDTRVEKKILRLSPSDEELDVLYQNCEFTVLASLYEGWSLTLPESYWYGKFCLCCDTPALKETAGDLAEYIHRWDEKTWAERIHYYHTHPHELAEREKRIATEWHPISWAECAQQVMRHLDKLCNEEMLG